MIYIRGDRLSPDLQAEVLRQYVHRWTFENQRDVYRGKCPACEQATRGGHIVTGEAPHARVWTRTEWHAHHSKLVPDSVWLQRHSFAVTSSGHLDSRQRHAEPAAFAS